MAVSSTVRRGLLIWPLEVLFMAAEQWSCQRRGILLGSLATICILILANVPELHN